MRSDMAKVIVERPRIGSNMRGKSKVIAVELAATGSRNTAFQGRNQTPPPRAPEVAQRASRAAVPIPGLTSRPPVEQGVLGHSCVTSTVHRRCRITFAITWPITLPRTSSRLTACHAGVKGMDTAVRSASASVAFLTLKVIPGAPLPKNSPGRPFGSDWLFVSFVPPFTTVMA